MLFHANGMGAKTYVYEKLHKHLHWAVSHYANTKSDLCFLIAPLHHTHWYRLYWNTPEKSHLNLLYQTFTSPSLANHVVNACSKTPIISSVDLPLKYFFFIWENIFASDTGFSFVLPTRISFTLSAVREPTSLCSFTAWTLFIFPPCSSRTLHTYISISYLKRDVENKDRWSGKEVNKIKINNKYSLNKINKLIENILNEYKSLI